MAGVAGETRPGPTARNVGKRRASGIYGAIITAAILAATENERHESAIVVTVLITLLVYWLAEEYAELLGEQVQDGRLPSWDHIRATLVATWPMVTSSFLPLVALVLAKWAGLSVQWAANIGLLVAIALLIIHVWRAARAVQLRSWQLVLTTSVALALGLVMIALKDVVLLHLH